MRSSNKATPYHWKIYSDFTSVPVWPVLENYAFASPKISLWQYKVKCPILAWNWSQSRLMSSKRPRFMGTSVTLFVFIIIVIIITFITVIIISSVSDDSLVCCKQISDCTHGRERALLLLGKQTDADIRWLFIQQTINLYLVFFVGCFYMV